MNVKDISIAFAAQNAIKHGSAKTDAVLGRVISVLQMNPDEILQTVTDAVNYVNSLSSIDRNNIIETNKDILSNIHEKKRKELNLPNVNNSIVVRFAPNPNGPLSFGHSRGVSILHYFWKKYGGEFNLRFDDIFYNPFICI